MTRRTPENTLAAIRLAADRGYDGVEVDVREARDGEPVLLHSWDGSLLVNCGVDRLVSELTSDALTRISYRASAQTLTTLEQALALCAEVRLRVMLDIKGAQSCWAAIPFFRRIASLVERFGLVEGSLCISDGPLAREHLSAGTAFPVSTGELRQVLAGEQIDLSNRFWFGIPLRLPDGAVAALRGCGASVIPAINAFQYPAHAHRDLASQDIRHLTALGVDGFQIDSMYEDLIRELPDS